MPKFIVFQITHSQVDFWGRKEPNVNYMKLMHKKRMYPPKVTVMVYSNDMCTLSKKMQTFTIEITGLGEEAMKINIAKEFCAGMIYLL